eukprot:6209312-Pleurochrysis_carterae.AAC.2
MGAALGSHVSLHLRSELRLAQVEAHVLVALPAQEKAGGRGVIKGDVQIATSGWMGGWMDGWVNGWMDGGGGKPRRETW